MSLGILAQVLTLVDFSDDSATAGELLERAVRATMLAELLPEQVMAAIIGACNGSILTLCQ